VRSQFEGTGGTWGCRSADGLSHTSQPIVSARDNHRHQRWTHSSSQIRSQHWSETGTGTMPTSTLINTTFLTIIWQTTVEVNLGLFYSYLILQSCKSFAEFVLYRASD